MKGYESKRLGSLVRIRTGKLDANANDPKGEYPFFTCSSTPLRITSYSYDCECVLVAGNGDLNVKYYKGKFDAYQRTYIIESLDSAMLCPKYLFRFLSDYIKELRRGSVGGVIKFIKLGHLTEASIPLLSLAEQEKIVKLLDETDELSMLRTQADRRTATLIPALFHEMFGDPVGNSKNWPRHRLQELCEGKGGIKAGPFGSSLKKDCYAITGPRVYGQEQVIAGDFSIGDYHISEEKFLEMAAYVVKSGDLLISLVGTIGRVVVVPDKIERGIINPRLLRLRPRTELLHPCYLSHVLTAPSIIKHLGNVATGITMGVLNAGLLKELDVPLPPLPLQKEFVARVTEIREMESAQSSSRKRLDDLFQSMLHRAFEGNL